MNKSRNKESSRSDLSKLLPQRLPLSMFICCDQSSPTYTAIIAHESLFVAVMNVNVISANGLRLVGPNDDGRFVETSGRAD